MTKFDPKKEYNELQQLPWPVDLENKNILKKVISARAALSELKGRSNDVLPNNNIIINSLIIQESKDSSEIENIVTTNDSLFKALLSEHPEIDPATKEVIGYNQALWTATEKIKDGHALSINLVRNIQTHFIKSRSGIRKIPGTNLKNKRTGEIIYTPPCCEDIIKDFLSNLEIFTNEPDKFALDPLIKMAVMHYQFEAIHPFYDGNGRTGRIMNILYLVKERLLESPLLYLSSYIIAHKEEYYKLLLDVTVNQNYEDWIYFMLDAVEKTSTATTNRIKEICLLIEETQKSMQSKCPNIHSKELLEIIFEHPYTKIQFLVDKNIGSRITASKYLNELTKAGILEKHKFGKENLYINKALYRLLQKPIYIK